MEKDSISYEEMFVIISELNDETKVLVKNFFDKQNTNVEETFKIIYGYLILLFCNTIKQFCNNDKNNEKEILIKFVKQICLALDIQDIEIKYKSH